MKILSRAIDNIPISTRQAYLDCPFEWTCPLGGRDASMALWLHATPQPAVLTEHILVANVAGKAHAVVQRFGFGSKAQ